LSAELTKTHSFRRFFFCDFAHWEGLLNSKKRISEYLIGIYFWDNNSIMTSYVFAPHTAFCQKLFYNF